MKRRMPWGYVAILSVLCAGLIVCHIHSVYASAGIEAPAQADIYSSIDDYLQACVERAHIPAMSVTIVNKDEILFSQSYGECESGDTPFLLGSVSKSFTAVCIMQLVERGNINLNAHISTYLPNATQGDKITVRQLLNHTSGLGEHQTLQNNQIVNEQGVHHYANVNYSLLGEIIESVSGKSYNDYITENLFQPLRLSHTAATRNESVENGLIDGYTNYGGLHIKTAHPYPSSKNTWITVPAGYLSSSANDLGKYLQMYLNGGNGIISEKSIDTMFYGDTVYVDGDVPYWYGYGWAMVKEPLSEPVLRHSGLVETGTSCVFILPESDVAIAIETNANDYFVTNNMMDSLGWGVVRMLLGEAPNEIAGNAYVQSHLWIDLIMLAVWMIAIFPLCLLVKRGNGQRSSTLAFRLISLVSLHVLVPVFLLLLIPIFFATPLWVAQAFVPDVFITVVASCALLFVGGLIKGVVLYKQMRNDKALGIMRR